MGIVGKVERYLTKGLGVRPAEMMDKGISAIFPQETLDLGVKVLEPFFRDNVG